MKGEDTEITPPRTARGAFVLSERRFGYVLPQSFTRLAGMIVPGLGLPVEI